MDNSEGSTCTCESEREHELLVARIDASFLKDADRRKNAPTSETLRAKALAPTNGHSGHSIKI